MLKGLLQPRPRGSLRHAQAYIFMYMLVLRVYQKDMNSMYILYIKNKNLPPLTSFRTNMIKGKTTKFISTLILQTSSCNSFRI